VAVETLEVLYHSGVYPGGKCHKKRFETQNRIPHLLKQGKGSRPGKTAGKAFHVRRLG